MSVLVDWINNYQELSECISCINGFSSVNQEAWLMNGEWLVNVFLG